MGGQNRLHIMMRRLTQGVLRTLRLEGFTPQPLNLKFESLNATTSKKEYDIRDISGILYNL
jgi:hypothetical protein